MCVSQWCRQVSSSQAMEDRLTALGSASWHSFSRIWTSLSDCGIHIVFARVVVPDVLQASLTSYTLPPSSVQNCLVPSRGRLPPEVSDQLQQSRPCEDETLLQYCLYRCQCHGWSAPQSAAEARQLYLNMLPYI